MRRTLALLLVFAAAFVGAAEARAQGVPAGRECRLRVLPGGVTGGTGSIVTLQDPFEVICSDGALVRASSGVVDQAARIATLTGDVYFEDQTRTLTSERAVYEINFGRLHATGNVVFSDVAEGTTLTGPELEYFRVMQGRPEALVNAPGRPHLTLRRNQQADGPAPDSAAAPLEVDADHMTIVGEDNLTATGNVLIEDPDMRAVADEAEHRGAAETLELRGSAQIHSRDYSLEGNTIFARMPGNSLQEVEARGEARLLGKDLTVTAPELDLLFEADLLQRSVARSDTVLARGQRPVATSPTFRLEADSIDAALPGQQLRTVVAVGNARGETIDTTGTGAGAAAPGGAPGIAMPGAAPGVAGVAAADSAIPVAGNALQRLEAGDSLPAEAAAELVGSDWIVGDTITGYFASVEAAGDTAAAPDGVAAAPGSAPDTTVVLERLVAVGAAKSLYHVAPEEGAAADARDGINFLSAAQIELTFADGQVEVANVAGLRRGMYLEPLAAATDTAGAPESGDTTQPDPGAEPPVEADTEQLPARNPGENE
jgi:lipopolysaccharide export system protein LptA